MYIFYLSIFIYFLKAVYSLCMAKNKSCNTIGIVMFISIFTIKYNNSFNII